MDNYTRIITDFARIFDTTPSKAEAWILIIVWSLPSIWLGYLGMKAIDAYMKGDVPRRRKKKKDDD